MINIIFADQLSPIKTFSTIINQSLVNIHNEQILNDLFYKYGNLQEIFDKEKAISFNDFYKAIIKIPSYKFKILFRLKLSFSNIFLLYIITYFIFI